MTIWMLTDPTPPRPAPGCASVGPRDDRRSPLARSRHRAGETAGSGPVRVSSPAEERAGCVLLKGSPLAPTCYPCVGEDFVDSSRPGSRTDPGWFRPGWCTGAQFVLRARCRRGCGLGRFGLDRDNADGHDGEQQGRDQRQELARHRVTTCASRTSWICPRRLWVRSTTARPSGTAADRANRYCAGVQVYCLSYRLTGSGGATLGRLPRRLPR